MIFKLQEQSEGQFSGGTLSGARDDGNLACLDIGGVETIFFWGGTDNSDVFADLYKSVDRGITITSLGATPWSKRNASAVFVRNNKIILCGGKNMSTHLLDAWEYDGTSGVELTPSMTGFGAR